MVAATVIESPCVRNCCLDDKDVCLGCFRTLEEIKSWGAAPPQLRQAIIRNADLRKKERGKKRE